jgi:zinc transport system substrate-binding protein
MKRFVLITCLFLFGFAKDKPMVTVTLAPYAYAIEKIAQSDIQVNILIPENANPHIYETKPKEMKKLAQSELWFCSGEQIEKKLKPNIKTKTIELNKNITLLHDGCSHCSSGHHHHNSQDLHTWMSPKNYLQQSKTILDALCESFPDKKTKFMDNFKELESELGKLVVVVENYSHKPDCDSFIVSHAAYQYLCHELNMNQISLEYEGKESSLKHLQKIYEDQQSKSFKKVFCQVQHGDMGAKRLASLLKSEVITVNPYQKNYPKAVQEVLEELP